MQHIAGERMFERIVMKKTVWFLLILVAAISGLHAMRLIQTCIITGRVSPPAYVKQVWVISGKDSVRTTLKDGVFIFQVKPGRYMVVAEAIAPYKNEVKRGVVAESGNTIDVGEIKLDN